MQRLEDAQRGRHPEPVVIRVRYDGDEDAPTAYETTLDGGDGRQVIRLLWPEQMRGQSGDGGDGGHDARD